MSITSQERFVTATAMRGGMTDDVASTTAALPIVIGTHVEGHRRRASAISRDVTIPRAWGTNIVSVGVVPVIWATVKRGVVQVSSG